MGLFDLRKPTYKSLKNKFDRVFSEFIRKRGADEGGTNECVTCGALKHWKELQAGHYYRSVHLATRWDERNVWPQCAACNVLRRGNYANYARFMYGKFSQQVLDELHDLHNKSVKFTLAELQEMIERYGRQAI